MSDKDKDEKGRAEKGNWKGKAAAAAGAAIGSAAIAAALLYASRRRDKADKKATPRPEDAPETD